MGTQRIHISLYFTVITIDAIVVFGANRMRNTMYHAKCILTTIKLPSSVQVWEAISSTGLSLQRKVNGNIDSAKYLSDIIHDIEMTCECAGFLQ